MSNHGFQSRSIYEEPGDPKQPDEPRDSAEPVQKSEPWEPGAPIEPEPQHGTLRDPVHLDLSERRRKQRHQNREPRMMKSKALLARTWARITRRRNRREWVLAVTKGAGIGAGLITAFLLLLWFTLPDISDPASLYASQSTVILDRNGVELYRLYAEQDRTPVPAENINNFIKSATISIEDERFFERGCLDIEGLSRAALSQILPGVFVRSGGSTLTRQFAGNALVGRKNSVVRKIRELMLACQLEQRYDKDDLLVLYLNRIPYGQNAYGIEQAAQNYFNSHAKDVTLAQSATLAALPQRPSYFSPYGHHVHTEVSDAVVQRIIKGEITNASQIPDAEVTIGLLGQNVGSGSTTVYIGGRTDQVLRNMLDQHMISKEEHDKAVKEALTMTFTRARESIRAPHLVLSVQEQVEELLGIDEKLMEQGGFQVTTTINWEIQQVAESVLTKHKDDLLKRFGAHNAALMSVDPVTREVLAYVGNIDFSDEEHEGKIDMVRSPRQPGSSFKPFVYATAFEQGYGPATPMYDVPTKFGLDQPQNFGGDFWGLMTVRTALAGSRNIPAIKAFFLAGGEEPVLKMAARLGVTAPLESRTELQKDNPDFEYGYPLAIGSAEVPLYQMVEGYAALADGGRAMPVVTILKIADKDGNIRYLDKRPPAEQVVDQRIAAQITSILSDVSARPNNDYWKSILSVPGYQAAAKTGTSNKCLEKSEGSDGVCKTRRPESTWTMGYTPNLVTGVWVGNATSQSLFNNADGLTTAAPLWNEFMIQAHKKLEKTKTAFELPANVTQPLVSKLSGQLASDCTPVDLRRSDMFLAGSTPTIEDTACVKMKVDKVTGLLASPACPQDAVEERAFFVPSSEKPERWPLWEQAVQEWAKKQMVSWNANPEHSGSLLPLPLPPTELCDPALTPGRLDKPTVSITSPSSGEGVPYPAFSPRASVQAGAALSEVTWFVDGKQVASFTEAPFSGMVRAPRSISKDGSHTLRVKIVDKYFNTATAETTFRFETDANAPQVRFLQPTDGATFTAGASVNISVDAEDAGGVELVQFFLDGTLLTTRRSAPYELTYTLNEAPGTHLLKATAKDSAGNESSDEVEITINY